MSEATPRADIVIYDQRYRQQVIVLILGIQNEEYHLNFTLEEQSDLEDPSSQFASGGFWLAIAPRDQVVGTIGLQVKAQHGVLKKFFVAAHHRGAKNGLSQRLYQTLLNRARELGLKSIILDTPAVAQRAQAFYERAGFVTVQKATLPVPYDFPDRNCRLMQLDLKPAPGKTPTRA